VATDMPPEHFKPYAIDDAELTGCWALYLSSKGAWLKGGLTSINWDVEELEAQKERIVKEGLLKITWMSILPASGGKGL
jgi:hypothetical protein